MEGARRIVTAEQAGKGKIMLDGAVGATDFGGGMGVVELWRARPGGEAASIDGAWSLDPPEFGHVFRIAEFPPAAPGDEPWMHRTETIDYAILLQGELTLVTDEGETTLRAGDVVVQQQASHGWINRSQEPCRLAVVLIDARPPVTPAA